MATEQNDSVAKDPMDAIEVSLLTCQPHDQIYSLYGHTALRIVDRNRGTDIAVNYGVFDTSKDFFVIRFVLGLTDYMMAWYDFNDFLAEYLYFGSGVYQQRLNLTSEQKQRLIMELDENSRPENIVYRYNFYYNNCTTRVRDLIFSALQGYEIDQKEGSLAGRNTSFRDLIHEKNNEHPWARFGNDMLLGVGSDKQVTIGEGEFIPEVLMNDFNMTTIIKDGEGKPLVDTAFWVLQPGVTYHPDGEDFPLSPTQCAILFMCAVMALVAVERLVVKKQLIWVWYSFASVYGIIGLLLFVMLFSEHPTVSINLQILIFNPLMLWFTLPKVSWRYRWHMVIVLCIMFFAGNFVQVYAEGTNIMALALSVIAANAIAHKKTR